jgi:hypothetical protein
VVVALTVVLEVELDVLAGVELEVVVVCPGTDKSASSNCGPGRPKASMMSAVYFR